MRRTLTLVPILLLASALILPLSCRREREEELRPADLIVVRAPASGEVHRVLVSEGVEVNANAPVIEIVVRRERHEKAVNGNEQSGAAMRFRSAQNEVEAARAEVVRHEAEIQRLAPLVAAGQMPASQLDAERALYEQAQRRLQRAQEAERASVSALAIEQRSPVTNEQAVTEEVVVARAPSAGTVRVISVKPGQRVGAGQPIATLGGKR
ncbi:MAG: hypothetical protein C4334_14735 [Pyrinomonas sp.]|uniref:hypothetical protein n=1 Tax=Pyrinomonas sp. TaxID=2080306 RepID=UPI00331728CC